MGHAKGAPSSHPCPFFRLFLAPQYLSLRAVCCGGWSLPISTPLQAVIRVGTHPAKKQKPPLQPGPAPESTSLRGPTFHLRMRSPNTQTLSLWPNSKPQGWSGGELSMSYRAFLERDTVRAESSAGFLMGVDEGRPQLASLPIVDFRHQS